MAIPRFPSGIVNSNSLISVLYVDKKKIMGIIDSQDAIIGNLLYDVASLVDDVRIKTSLKAIQHHENNLKRTQEPL